MSTVKFPLEIVEHQGKVMMTSDPGNELNMLFQFSKNTRVDDPDYGIAGELLMQQSSNLEYLSVSLISIKSAIVEYCGNVMVKLINIKKDTMARSTTVDITYAKNLKVTDVLSNTVVTQ